MKILAFILIILPILMVGQTNLNLNNNQVQITGGTPDEFPSH